MLFYKLVLERENIHHFKRFFLLAALLVSIGIPIITFTTFIEAAPIINAVVFSNSESVAITAEIAPTFSNYLSTILWSIYFLGVMIFLGRFTINLFQLIKRIKQNPKYIKGNLVHVLITDLVYPHTFLKYIFLNKTKYETHDIPKEVMLHEETHAKQKHALDILFIELMQIIFWFNPLLYFIKKDIKLNHEFLADQAVLEQGTDTKTYQHILLAFSASGNKEDAQTHHLANAINYSLIKKRFTVMKSHTSNTVKWVKGLIILPVLAVLIYSFSSKNEVYQPAEPNTFFSETPQELLPIENTSEADKLVGATKDKLKHLNANTIKYKKNSDNNLIINNQKGASKEQIAEYNKLAKYYNSQSKDQYVLKMKDMERIQYLYSLMTEAQKKVVEPLPNFPPPPPPSAQNMSKTQQKEYDEMSTKARNGENYSYKYTDKDGKVVNVTMDKNNTTFPPPPPPPVPANATPEQKAKYKDVSSEYYKKYKVENGKVSERLPPPPIPANATPEQQEKYKKVQDEYNQKYKVKKGEVSNIPPPPPPPIPANATPEQQEKYKQVQDEYNQKYKVKNGEVSNIPPPPPPAPMTMASDKKTDGNTKTGFITINNEKHFYATVEGKTKYYNRWGNQVDKNGNILSTTQTNGDDVVPGQKISKVYQNDQVVSEFNKNWVSDTETLNPPPPPPISPLDHVIQMAKKDASFFYEGKSVSSDRAIALLKSNRELNILTRNTDSNIPRVFITKDPINHDTISKTSFPKPTAENDISHLKVMNRHGAKFYLDGKEVSFDDALKAVRKNKNADINSTIEPPVVKISTKLIGVMGKK
tara:strand:- start:268752 stop:271196 length:2445 start_codon:yes stop_codon:yes gene_type:complete